MSTGTARMRLALVLVSLVSCIVEYTVPLRDADCPEGESACGDVCVDPRADDLHCGACDHRCMEGLTCIDGTCTPRCDAGLEACDGRCVDLTRDDLHCGRCHHRCDDDGWCSAGTCREDCTPDCDEAREWCDAGACACRSGFLRCDDVCIDPSGDPRHCGGCGNACDGPCGAAECRDEACTGFVARCGDTCTNLDDVLHCGGCDQRCDADELCIEGECEDSDDDDDDDD